MRQHRHAACPARYLQAKNHFMKKTYYTLILVLLLSKLTYACSCNMKKLAEWQKIEVENSECIFVGKITEVNKDLTYKITVIESLDGGDSHGNVYIGQNWKTCYPYVEGKGTWLIYARMENGFLKMNMCGISRPFDKPFAPMSDSKELDEYSKQIGLEKMTDEELYSGMLKLHRIDLANEIIALRKRRSNVEKASR